MNLAETARYAGVEAMEICRRSASKSRSYFLCVFAGNAKYIVHKSFV